MFKKIPVLLTEKVSHQIDFNGTIENSDDSEFMFVFFQFIKSELLVTIFKSEFFPITSMSHDFFSNILKFCKILLVLTAPNKVRTASTRSSF